MRDLLFSKSKQKHSKPQLEIHARGSGDIVKQLRDLYTSNGSSHFLKLDTNLVDV